MPNSDNYFSMNTNQSTHPQHSCENSVLQVLWPAGAVKEEWNLKYKHVHITKAIDISFINELSDNHFKYLSSDWIFPILLEIRNNVSVKRRNP